VWGGGLIETEDFYAACDRLGLLVWQEFSQSSSGIDNIPSDDAVFVARMRAEAEAIVPLRRNHPSLAVWCGGNELQDADGTPLTDDRSAVLRALHEAVAHLDPDRIWLPTSPSGPRFGNRLSEIELDPDGLHDVHGPWEHQGLHDQTTLWDRGTSLFNSEFGVEGMTNRRAHERLISPERRWPADRSNPVYRHLGDWWNNAPLVEASFGGRLGDLEALRRASQHLQAEGLRYAVEANRRRWPRNSGSIPWQLNESYPNAWCTSVIDHGGEPKPAFFAVARAFAPSVVCASFASSVLDDAASLEATIWAWSRDGSVAEGTVGWRIAGLDGRVVANGGQAVDLDGGFPVRIPGPAAVAIPDDAGPIVFLDLVLEDAGGVARARNRYLFALGADLAGLTQLPPANVAITAVERGDDWCVRLEHHGGPAAVAVVIADARPGDVAGWPELADNAFDLLPGEAREVAVHWAAAPPGPRTLRVAGWNVAESIVP
jgi:beta-mannosidase